MSDGAGQKGRADRWARQGLQLPPNVAKEFKDLTSTQAAFGGVQVMGTAAIALFLGMPEDLRDAVCDYVVRNAWRGLDGIDSDEAWRTFVEAMRSQVSEKTVPGEPSIEPADAPRWFISRILDPEVTPPPGQKASDKAKARDRKSG